VVCTVCCVTGTCVTGTCVTSADRIDIAVRCAPQGGDSGGKETRMRCEEWDFEDSFWGVWLYCLLTCMLLYLYLYLFLGFEEGVE
jgi:hypothetical protein